MRRAGDACIGDLHATQAEAVKAARSVIQATGGELRIHDKDGRLARTFTLGRDNFAKIGAVEGIKPTRDAMIRTKEFDRKGLSSDERRRAIIEAHIPKG